jgi:hypothetical protein
MTIMTNETLETIATVRLTGKGLTGLRELTTKLNKRAKKCGVVPVVVTVVSTESVVNEKTGYPTEWYNVEIDGCAPCINGWSLAARIENNDVIGSVTRIVPGKFADDDYSAYRDHDFGCDHCNTKRKRNDVFVLADSDGRKQVVGRNCLADFLRTTDANGFAEWAAWMDQLANIDNAGCEDEAGDCGTDGRYGQPTCNLKTFLSAVRACTVKIGWTSRTASREQDGRTATADDAFFLLFGSGELHTKFVRRNELENHADYAEYAEKAIAWALSLTPEQTAQNDYLDVLVRIATAGTTDYSLAGYAASMGAAMDRDNERQTKNAENAENAKAAVHIGSPKERLRDLVVTVVRVRYCEGQFGVSTIVAMETTLPDGSVAPMTWFASGSKEFDEGTDYNFTGTVKSHDDDNRYGRQTKVNRCKLTEIS